MDSAIELVTVLLIFVFVLALTYFVTRWIAGYQRTMTSKGNLSLVESIRISNNQFIHIVRAGKDRYLVIGVGKEGMTLLADLTGDELREPLQETGRAPAGKSFSDILEGFKKKNEKKGD